MISEHLFPIYPGSGTMNHPQKASRYGYSAVLWGTDFRIPAIHCIRHIFTRASASCLSENSCFDPHEAGAFLTGFRKISWQQQNKEVFYGTKKSSCEDRSQQDTASFSAKGQTAGTAAVTSEKEKHVHKNCVFVDNPNVWRLFVHTVYYVKIRGEDTIC